MVLCCSALEVEPSTSVESFMLEELNLNFKQNSSYHHHHSISFNQHRQLQQLQEEELDGGGGGMKAEIKHKGGDDLFVTLKIPLFIGALLGLIPIRGLSKKKSGRQTFTWMHPRTIVSIVITSMIFCHIIFIGNNFVKALTDKHHNSAGNLIGVFSGVWFYIVGMLVYVFFLLRSKQLCLFFDTWVKTSEIITETLTPDWKIIRDMKVITGIVLLDCCGENILYHFYAMKIDKPYVLGVALALKLSYTVVYWELTATDVLTDYYNSNQYMFSFFAYNPAIALAVFVTNKWTLFAWNFGDVILMLVFRALYSRYAGLNAYLEGLMVPDGSIRMIQKGAVSWAKVRRNFLLITKLLEEANYIFSPLIWLSYTTDIFFVCNQLYLGLVPSNNQSMTIGKVYVAWSLIHLVMRTFAVNMMAAKINEHAHRISRILQHCYPEEYDNNVRRLERFLGSRIIGITGNGCFIITRSFILMIISAIFTLEVVLLQNASLNFG